MAFVWAMGCGLHRRKSTAKDTPCGGLTLKDGRFFNSQAGALIVGYANLILEESVLDPVTGKLPDSAIRRWG